MKSAKAFTLVELIVAMVLSTLVIAMTYNVYNRTESSFRRFSEEVGYTSELLQLQKLLNDDCNHARLMTYEDHTMSVQRFDYGEIRYTIMADRMIREAANAIDTFVLGSVETSEYYLFNTPPILEMLLVKVQAGNAMTYKLTAQALYSNRLKFERNHSE